MSERKSKELVKRGKSDHTDERREKPIKNEKE